MRRPTLYKLIGGAIGLAVAMGWPALKRWKTESSSACGQILSRAEIELATGKRIDKFAGHERDHGCTAAWFAVRAGFDPTGELLRVEMNRIRGHYDYISQSPLWLREAPKPSPLDGVGERAILIEHTDGSHAVFAEAAGVTVELHFRREFSRDKVVQVARAKDLAALVASVGAGD